MFSEQPLATLGLLIQYILSSTEPPAPDPASALVPALTYVLAQEQEQEQEHKHEKEQK